MQKVHLFGLDFFSVGTITEAVKLIFLPIENDNYPILMTPNIDQIINLENAPELKEFLSNSYLIYPDGMPIVWASKIFGEGLASRITGSDLFPVFWSEVQQREQTVFFISASDDVGDRLKNEYSKATSYSPPFFEINSETYQAELVKISLLISDIKPDFVVIGLSYPKREILCRDLIVASNLQSTCKFLLIGAAPEFYLGIKRRAPVFLQNIGLEWLHRLSSEPNRLFKRYLINGFKFIPIFFRELLRNK